MPKEIIKNSLSVFEQIKNTDHNGNEYWMARQLSKVLDYADFRNFTGVIEKAIDLAKNEPGVCIPGNMVQIEITNAMISELKAAIIRTGLSEVNAQVQLDILQEKGDIPKVGQMIPSPAIQYKSLSTGEYPNEVNYSFASNMAATHQCPTGKSPKFKKHLRYTDDFKKIESKNKE